jgi:hypothetical protein
VSLFTSVDRLPSCARYGRVLISLSCEGLWAVTGPASKTRATTTPAGGLTRSADPRVVMKRDIFSRRGIFSRGGYDRARGRRLQALFGRRQSRA